MINEPAGLSAVFGWFMLPEIPACSPEKATLPQLTTEVRSIHSRHCPAAGRTMPRGRDRRGARKKLQRRPKLIRIIIHVEVMRMRKPVQTEPTPVPDNHARGEKQANIEKTEGVSRRCLAKGEAGAGSTANSAAGPVAATASISLDDESSLNDAWLVERARHGDHAAFAVLVRRYERKLIRVLARLVRDPELARDLAQETFWRVYNRLERFDTARRFGPWLFRVAVNLGLDWLRRSRSEPSPPASIDRPHG